MGQQTSSNNQVLNINVTPYHGTKTFFGVEDNQEKIKICTTEEEEAYVIGLGYRLVKSEMISDSGRTNMNWRRVNEQESNNIDSSGDSSNRRGSTSSSSSSFSMNTSISDITTTDVQQSLPLVFPGIKPLTARNVISMYERGDDRFPPIRTWTKAKRHVKWEECTPQQKKNNSTNYYNLCKDYIYLHNNREINLDIDFDTKLSRAGKQSKADETALSAYQTGALYVA
jgi:hypothetical protein